MSTDESGAVDATLHPLPGTRARSGGRPKLEGLQVLRAVAALLVVGYHLSLRGHELLDRRLADGSLNFGAAGVDAFFVLSGFIIYSVHRRDIGRPSQGRSYLLKRVIRIYPIYWIVTLVALPIYLAGYGVATKRSLAVIVKSFLLIPQNPGVFPVINVGWTLSYEVFFYAMFLLLIIAPRSIAVALWALWLIPTAIVTALVITVAWQPPFTLLYTFVWDGRNLEFLLGVAVAWAVHRVDIRRPGLLVVAGSAVFLGAGLWITQSRWLALHFTAHPLILFGLPSAVVVLGIAAADLRSTRRPPGTMIHLGDASYVLYLIHFGVITGAYLLFRELGLAGSNAFEPYVVAVAIAVSVAAFGVYRFLERPMLERLRARFLQGRDQAVATRPASGG